jgi:hypothetical protein
LEVASHGEELDRLRDLLDASHASLNTARATEKAAVAKHRNHASELECTKALQMLLTRREEVTRRFLTSLFASQWETFLLGVFCTWREACADGTATEEYQKLKASMQEHLALHAKHLSREVCLARRESTARHLLTSLLAERLELQVRGTFCAWYDAVFSAVTETAQTMPTAADALREVLRARQQECAVSILCTVMARELEVLARGCFFVWRDLLLLRRGHDLREFLRAWNGQRLLGLQALLCRTLSAWAWVVLAAHFEDPLVQVQDGFCARREEAIRRVFTNLLAVQLELFIRGAFSMWSDAVSSKCLRNVDAEGRPLPMVPSSSSEQQRTREAIASAAKMASSSAAAPATAVAVDTPRSVASSGIQETHWDHYGYEVNSDPEL